MHEIGPAEKMMAMIQKFEKELDLMKSEVAAFLPDDDRPARDWFEDPITGRKRYIKRRKL